MNEIMFQFHRIKKQDMVITVLNRRSSSGKTTRYDNLIDRFGCSSLNLFRCSASTWGNFFTRILQHQLPTYAGQQKRSS